MRIILHNMSELTVPTRFTSVTVVVPTYQEFENIPLLVARLDGVRQASGLDLELLLMDDDSRDGSDTLVAGLALPWVTLVTRNTERGLSHAVLEGLMLATREVVVVMDADLSHPPEKIPEMIRLLGEGFDVVVGSRFTEGGSTADDWGVFRWLNSRVATALAMPLSTITDPMSGFFAMRRSTVMAGRDFNPIGYKILLELIVKCRCQFIIELPIHFENRQFGASKLSLGEQFNYLRHLRRLYVHKFGTWSHLVQFLVVGLSGLFINLLVLDLLLRRNIGEKVAVALAIIVSMLWNFALNRRFSFSYARDQSIVWQFLGFVAACSLGATINYFTTLTLWRLLKYKELAATCGVAAGTGFNFAASRFLVFRKKHVRPQ
jgi:dolichol-phosphate mannosyltransferase